MYHILIMYLLPNSTCFCCMIFPPSSSLTWNNRQFQLCDLGISQLKAGTEHLTPTTYIHTTRRHRHLRQGGRC